VLGSRTAGAAGLVLCAALAGLPAAGRADPESDQTRARMREIFESMRVLLPLSVAGERFGAAENRAAVASALESLARNADQLAAHAGRKDPERRFLGRSLADDARAALDRYREGRADSAAFLVQQATENCIACHTKLESPGDSPLSQQFVDRTALAELPPEERARLLIATRQFDEAESTLEQVIASPGLHPSEMLAPITDYLVVSIRVKNDFDRPLPALERFAKRPDLWRQLRADVEAWIAALRELRGLRDRKPEIATARRLVEEAGRLVPFPADRRGLVHYVVASSVLHRLLDAGPLPPAERSEAYYLLGVCELHIGDTFWVSQADFYLETAVRAAPAAPSADLAYALLEEALLESYTGSSGVNVPDSVARRLDALRALVDAN
jgi:tetratricopeptide (TPR) repeat protein